MTKHIRTGGVNLITGLFDLSHAAFADYIKRPKARNDDMKRKLPILRDYRDASFVDLQTLRIGWEEYQDFVRESKSNREKKRHTANDGHGTRANPNLCLHPKG
jgi:hypothetical protein